MLIWLIDINISEVVLTVDKCYRIVLHDTVGSMTLYLKLIYCSWLNGNKKPENSEKLFYFTNSWLPPNLIPKVCPPNLV